MRMVEFCRAFEVILRLRRSTFVIIGELTTMLNISRGRSFKSFGDLPMIVFDLFVALEADSRLEEHESSSEGNSKGRSLLPQPVILMRFGFGFGEIAEETGRSTAVLICCSLSMYHRFTDERRTPSQAAPIDVDKCIRTVTRFGIARTMRLEVF